MENEPLMLYPTENQPGLLHGTLLFSPTRINKIRIWTSTGYRDVPLTYFEGIKEIHNQIIILLRGIDLPFLDPAEIERPLGSPDSYPATQDGTQGLIHSEVGLFQARQILISYEHKNQNSMDNLIKTQTQFLNIKNRLEKDNQLDIFVYGDSISAGCNASKFMGISPNLPPYSEQIVNHIKTKFPIANVRLLNQSKGGESSKWGEKQLTKIVHTHRDFGFHLNIIAWGANDAGGNRSPENFERNIRHQLRILQHHNQEMKSILVASSLPNPRWNHAHHELLQRYRTKLYEIANKSHDNVVVADLTDIWQKLLSRKDYYDLTGNGLNHPNDFGHRIYAETILKSLDI